MPQSQTRPARAPGRPSDAVFEEYRPVLAGLAYRLLGSMWDAEDVVQEAYLRWIRDGREDVREPRAFLITVVSRLALDQLRSARVTREAYVGPWLPEPVETRALGPLDTAELRDTLSYATLHLMERLTPPERAVFVLREAFAMPYDAIAEITGLSAAHCRQLNVRAGRRLAGDRAGREGPAASARENAALLTRFLEAARGGDLAALTDLLAQDVVAWGDGGGRTRAALRPIRGRAKVTAFILGLVGRYPPQDVRLTDVNGQPAMLLTSGGHDQLALADVRGGRIQTIFAVLNPDKLTRVLSRRE